MTSTAGDEATPGYSQQFQAVVNMLPVGVYTVWSSIGIYVVGSSGYCVDDVRAIVLGVAYGVLTVAAGVLAVLDRHQGGLPFGKPYWPDAVRAIGSSAIFAGLAIFTPPGSTCMLPGKTPGQSLIPDYAAQVFVITLYALSAALTWYGPQLHTVFHGQAPIAGGQLPGDPKAEPLLRSGAGAGAPLAGEA